jgi:outer membrane murein-binding lipoprotein Lpp
MKIRVVFFSAIAGVILLTGCISSHERVVEKETTERPVVREKVIEKAPDTTINVNK